MEQGANGKLVYQFGKFILDPQEKTLFSGGKPLHLPAKEFETLLLLVENNGKALTKEEMMEAIWRDAFVEETNLAKKISRLRKLLNANSQQYIETLPKHGYRFSADVNQIFESPTKTILEKREPERLAVQAEDKPVEDEIEEKPIALPMPKKRVFTAPRLIFGLIVLLLGVGVWVWRAGGAREISSIAVLPLKSLNKGENNRALGLGLTDTLITKIGDLGQIAVRPIGAVASYADAPQEAIETGRKLNVDAILEGTIQESEGRLRINIRLVKVANGKQIWAEQFDGETAKIFDLQDRLTEQTAQALKLKLGAPENEQLAKRSTADTAAFDAYLKGRYFWNQRTEQGLKKAVGFFHQAVERDPNYARAYSGLANCYILLGVWGAMPPMSAMPKAKEAVLNALQKDGALADARTSLAFIKWVYDWDWKGADEEFQKALQLNPNYATAHHWRAYYLATLGRFDEAAAHINKARELEGSLSLSINTDIGELYCWARQYDKAIAQLQEVVRIAPDFAAARNALGIAYLKKGQVTEAVAELEAARRLDNSPRMISSLGHAYGVSGQRDKAIAVIAELKKLSQERYVSAFSIAVVHAGLGEDETAVSRLEEAYAERSDAMAILGVYPLLDNLRQNTRFAKLQQRLGLPM